MKKYIIFSAIAIAGLSIFYLQSCKEKEPLITTGSIVGVVTDADAKQPLRGVSVTITPGGSAKVTGDDGAYSFDELDAKEYTLAYTKDDYNVATKKVTVKANVNTSVDAALEPIKAALEVSAAALDFGTTLSALPLDVSNSGKGTLAWSISYDSTWFSCSPKSGVTEKNVSPVVVTVSRDGKERGSYTQVLTISSNGGSRIVTLSMSVEGIALGIEPQEVNFGSLTSSMQITLTNQGTGTISYTAETSNAWITLSKEKGSITQNDYLTVIVSRESLSSGSYTGTITVKSGIEIFVVPVIMEISAEEKPVVGFDQIKAIAYNSAVFGGSMISIGSTKVTRYGFCWNTSPSPTVDNNKTNLGDCNNPLAFESTATNLQHSTQYYVRAYAENSVGLSYSSERSFTTSDLPTVPSVITGAASEITASSAKIGATLSSLGNEVEATQHGHVWSLNANPSVDLATRTSLGALSATGQYASSLTGLLPNKEYHVRAYAINSKGTAYGDDVTFTTATADATLTTAAATDIVHNAATCGGTITSDGGHIVTERGVCWATAASPTVNDHTVASLSSENTFTCRITGLITATAYHMRAYLRTQSGAVYYGDNKTFTTTQVISLPTVDATTVSNIGTERATLTSAVTSDGNSTVTDCGFVYATWQNPTVDAAEKVSYGADATNFGKSITTLAEGTTYYVRAYAVNAMGTSYGEEVRFGTLAVTAPALANVNVASIGVSGATASSSVTNNGNADVTEAGFCWSESPYPTIYDDKISYGTGAALSADITGLKSGTIYYVRAYATNSKGTGYSADASFTTADLPTVPSVITGAASEITASSAKIGATLSSLGNEAEVTQHGHVWSLNANPSVDLATRTSLGALSATGQYASSLTDLLPNKEYHVRAYAVNSKGTAYGDDVTFTTTTADATLTTAAATDIMHNAATCGGTITSDGGHTVTERGVCWATAASPTVNDHTVTSSSSENTFTCRITGLATTTAYHVRAYLRTQSGAVYYGDNKTFTTTQVVSLPTVDATTVSNIGTERATLASAVTSDGNSTITDCGFVYATWQNPTVDAAEKASYGADATNFGKNITTLVEGTTYYVRAYAVNAMGTSYGEEVRFGTLAVIAPALANVSVTGVSISGATASSSITNNGNADVTEAGFCWSESPYPTIYDDKISYGTGAAFSADITGLKSGTIYYVRAYATNSKGTGYSADASFTTITLPTNVIFVSATQGNDSNGGRSWNSAKKTIGAAMTAATAGEQVWVTEATYQENVTLKEGVNIYGGFAGTEVNTSQRTASSRTMLLRNRFIQTVAFTTSTVVDGFEVSMASTAINFPGGCQFNNLAINNCSNAITITGCVINNFTFSNNTGVDISISISNSTVENCSFSQNGNITFANSAVSSSTSISTSGTITLSNTTLTNATATGNGVIRMQDNSKIEGCSITQNSYVHMDGGNLINCKIQNNTGGGILVTSGGGNIEGCTITGNSPFNYPHHVKGTYGSFGSERSYVYYSVTGIYIDETTKLQNINIYNCTISNATADYTSRYVSYSDSYGMGIYAIKGTVNIINSIIFQSDNLTRGYPIFVWEESEVSLYVSNVLSPITFTTGRNNVVITNLADLKLSNDYVPYSDSPAVNAGDNSFVTTSKDVNGNTRIQGGTVDIGAVESGY